MAVATVAGMVTGMAAVVWMAVVDNGCVGGACVEYVGGAGGGDAGCAGADGVWMVFVRVGTPASVVGAIGIAIHATIIRWRKTIQLAATTAQAKGAIP